MNNLSYSSLVPVIDGGISFKIKDEKLIHGIYRAQTVGPERACLDCMGAIDTTNIELDRDGLLDDPKYIEELREIGEEPQRQNIIPFSFSLAGLESIQFIELVTGLAGRGDLGKQEYQYRTGEILPERYTCVAGCIYQSITALGDTKIPFLMNDKTKQRELDAQEDRRKKVNK